MATRTDADRTLEHAGFVDTEAVDLTAEFATTARAWLRGYEAHADALAPLDPPGEYETALREKRDMLDAIEAGLLRRGLFTGRRRD